MQFRSVRTCTCQTLGRVGANDGDFSLEAILWTMVRFYLPDQPEAVIKSQADLLRSKGLRAIRKLEYEHNSSRFVVEVGSPRQEYRRKTGPRGGYIKNADFSRMAHSTGTVVNLIIETPSVIEVYSSPRDGWGFPSLVGDGEVTEGTIEYFDPWEREEAVGDL